MKTATFVHDEINGYYIPANKAAIAATAIISNRFPNDKDMLSIRAAGYEPRLLNGQPIAEVRLSV